MKKRRFIALILLTITLVACSPGQEPPVQTLRIATQYGLAYAPLTLCEKLSLIEDQVPGLEIEWVQLSNTAAIREAMLAGEIDMGFLGIPPFLIGYENGMPWQLFTGLSESPVSLMTNQNQVETLSDLDSQARIALPQPGSIQHILLMMAAEKAFGNPTYYDESLLSVKHPDGLQLLLNSQEIAAHFTSPPYLFEEQKAGMREIVKGDEAFGGPFTFIVGAYYPSERLDDQTLTAVYKAIGQAQTYIKDKPQETIALLNEDYQLAEEVLYAYLYESGITYTQSILGLDRFIDFMETVGFLKKTRSAEDLLWDLKDE